MHDTADGSGPREPRGADDPRISEHKRRVAEIDRLGDEIAVISAQIQAATYELLVRLREFDKREGWGHHGAKSCAHWLAWRTSLDPGAAREWVRVARALERLPVLSEAMRQGEVSYSKARALTRIATPETESELVELARAGTAQHIEKVVRACRRYGPKEEREKDLRVLDSRYVQVSHDEDGMLILRARLDPVAGAVVERALDAAYEAVYQKHRANAGDRPEDAELGKDPADAHSACLDSPAHELAPAHRRADALVLLAESALAGGLDSGTAGDRYQVVVHVDAAVLAEPVNSPDPIEYGVSALEDGQHVSAETCRRVACDSAKIVMTHAPDGSVLDVGRKTRTISPALRRVLVDRDGGCRFPGCNARRCDAHHLKALGRRRRDEPREHHPPVPLPSSTPARGGVSAETSPRSRGRVPQPARTPRSSRAHSAPPAERPVPGAARAARGRRDRRRFVHRNADVGRFAAGSRPRGRVVSRPDP